MLNWLEWIGARGLVLGWKRYEEVSGRREAALCGAVIERVHKVVRHAVVEATDRDEAEQIARRFIRVQNDTAFRFARRHICVNFDGVRGRPERADRYGHPGHIQESIIDWACWSVWEWVTNVEGETCCSRWPKRRGGRLHRGRRRNTFLENDSTWDAIATLEGWCRWGWLYWSRWSRRWRRRWREIEDIAAELANRVILAHTLGLGGRGRRT